MASPQKENGHIQIANELYEAILRYGFTLREVKIILTVMRYTYGFNRKKAQLSARFISKATGIKYQHIAESLTGLYKKNVLKILEEYADGKGRIIMLNKDYDTWNVKITGSKRINSYQKVNSILNGILSLNDL